MITLDSALASRSPDVAKLDESLVRETFYNMMADTVVEDGLDVEKLPQEILCCLTLLKSIDISRDLNKALRCSGGQILTSDNCPTTFKPLIDAILLIKNPITLLPIGEISLLKNSFSSSLVVSSSSSDRSRGHIDALARQLHGIAQEIMKRREFREIIQQVLGFCLQCKSSPSVQTRAMNVITPTTESLSGVTEALIRTTFYQIMSTHTLTSGLISKEDLESREPYIYIALSVHAIIVAMLDSRLLRGALALLGDKALTFDNCPEKYKRLLKFSLDTKDSICSLSDEQVHVLKLCAVDNENVQIPEAVKTPQLMKIAAQINSVATEISQLGTFKAIIEKVIQFCL